MAGNSAAILTAQPPPDADVRLAYGDSQLQFGDPGELSTVTR